MRNRDPDELDLPAWVFLGMLTAAWIAAALAFLPGCSSAPEIYTEQELVHQRLKFREGFPGKLTYSVCKAKDAKGACTQLELKEFDLSSEAVRRTFNDLGFICRVGEERGKICRDSPGICSITYVAECPIFWCKKNEVVAKRWDATQDHMFLIAAGTRCYQAQKYPFGS